MKVRGVVTDSENVPVVGYGSGQKTMPSGTTMHMSDYNGKMGTGVIDAWKLLMNIEGVPFVTVRTGNEAVIDLKEWFGDEDAYLTWKGVDVADEDMQALAISSHQIDGEGSDGICQEGSS